MSAAIEIPQVDFELRPATRKALWIWLAVYGPSGSGKTCSLLRLATGMREVCGGEIDVVDTENHRAERYAPKVPGAKEPDTFIFRHGDLTAPFDPLRYYACVKKCVDTGARIVIVDSMSHEHTGEGGVLEQHATQAAHLAEKWRSTPEKVSQSAWIVPKARRDKARDLMSRLPCHILFAFRAKEKTKSVGSKIENLGFMAVGGDEWIYECEASALLMPQSGGVPTWGSNEVGEKMMIKKPGYLRDFTKLEGPFSEEMGRVIARWAKGEDVQSDEAKPAGRPALADELARELDLAETEETVSLVARQIKGALSRGAITRAEYDQLLAQGKARRAQLPAAPGNVG